MNSKLNTEEIKFMIPDYITGTLNDTERAQVDEALKNSSELQEFYSEMKGTFELVSSVKYTEPAPQYWNSLLPRIHDRIESREAKGFSWDNISAIWKVLVPIAAVILIAVIYYIAKPSETQLTDKKKTEEIKKNEQIKNDTSKDENNSKNEKIEQNKVTEEKKNDNIVKEQNLQNNKSYIIKKNSVKPDNATANKEVKDDNKIIKEIPEVVKDEQLASDIEETSLFADGEASGFDEETESDLKKLNDNEQQLLLKELENTNL